MTERWLEFLTPDERIRNEIVRARVRQIHCMNKRDAERIFKSATKWSVRESDVLRYIDPEMISGEYCWFWVVLRADPSTRIACLGNRTAYHPDASYMGPKCD